MGKAFRDLRVWQESMDLTVMVYRLTATLPETEKYGLRSQMQRAAASIPSNLAEGSARGSRKDFRQFVLVAKGSNFELQTQLELTIKLGLASKACVDPVMHQATEVAKMLNGLSDFLIKPKMPVGQREANEERKTNN